MPRSPQVVSFVFLWTFAATFLWCHVPRMCAKCSAHPFLLRYLRITTYPWYCCWNCRWWWRWRQTAETDRLFKTKQRAGEKYQRITLSVGQSSPNTSSASTAALLRVYLQKASNAGGTSCVCVVGFQNSERNKGAKRRRNNRTLTGLCVAIREGWGGGSPLL